MPKVHDAYTLVHSLETLEKRYFAIFAERHKADPKYYRLYKLLDAMPEYDYDKIVEAFPEVQDISAFQTELKDQILLAMWMYESSKKESLILQRELHNVGFLRNKGMYKQARTKVRKLREKVGKGENYLAQIMVIELELSIYQGNYEPNTEAKVQSLVEELRNAKGNLQLQTEFSIIREQIFSILRGNPTGPDPDAKKKLATLLSEIRKITRKKSMDFRNACMYHSCHAMIHQFNGESDKVYSHRKKLIGLWEQHDDRRDRDPMGYAKALSNFATACARLKRYKEMASAIEALNSVSAINVDDEAELVQNRVYLALLYALQTAKFSEVIRKEEVFRLQLEKYKNGINPARTTSIRYLYACVFFLNGNWSKSNEWTQMIINEKSSEVRIDIQTVAKVLRCVLMYELKAQDIHNSIRSTIRALREKDMYKELYKELLSKLKKLSNCADNSCLELTYRDLWRVNRDAKFQEVNSRYLLFHEIQYWVLANLLGKPLHDTYSKYKGKDLSELEI